MPVSANTVWEMRATGAATNGGGFVTGASGVDYSQQDAAQWALTGVTSAGSGNTVLSASAHADMVGNIAYLVSGTNGVVGRYEVTSVVAGVSITFSTNAAGTSICSGVLASGVINIGGAFNFGSSLEDAFFEAFQPGNKLWVRNGNYTLSAAVSIAAAGGSQNPIVVRGYTSSRGDNPTPANKSNMPSWNLSTFTFVWGANWDVYYLRWKGTTTSANMVTMGTGGKVISCYSYHYGTTADRSALAIGSAGYAFRCEAVCLRGRAITNGSSATIDSCEAHDSVIGIRNNSSSPGPIIYNLVYANVTSAIWFNAAVTNASVEANVIYGSESKIGNGLALDTGSTGVKLKNNIIAGCTTGVNHADSGQVVSFDEYNDYYNNTTNATNWTIGATSITTNPSFTNVGQISRTGATSSNTGNTLVDAGATFVTSGLVAGRDFVHITSTSGTTGKYGIASVDSETQLTLDVAPGNSSSNVAYNIVTGKNFLPTGAI